MSERFPAVNARQVIRVIKKLGFYIVRETGSSHAIFRRDSDNRRTVVPRHGKTILKRRTLKSILNDVDLTVEEFRKLI